MPKTVFVNPSRPRRKKRKARNALIRTTTPNPPRRRRRRNAGIVPFTAQSNPLILSNPRRRRRRQRNPLKLPTLKGAVSKGVSMGAGAGIALASNAFVLSRIQNPWFRRGAQFVAAVIGGAFLSNVGNGNMGQAYGGAMMYPLMQDLASDLLGIGVAAGTMATEADLDALAADLEDVMDEMDEQDSYGEDPEEQLW